MSAGESCVQRVLRSLQDPAVGTIVLYGLGGIGKTWAARRVHDLAGGQGSLFDIALWVSLSSGSTLWQVQKMVLEMLQRAEKVTTGESMAAPDGTGGDDDGEERLRLRAWQRVRAALSRVKFLLVLDDLWLTEDDVLSMIGIPVPGPAVGGSKVLVTTGSRRVLATTRPDLLIEMAGLPFRESLGLFLDSAGEAAAHTQPLQSLLNQVVDRCQGIPLAIVLLGGALQCRADDARHAPSLIGEMLSEASSALGQLSCNMVAYRAAMLGYRALPNDDMREFLLNCAVIDQRVGFSTQDLLRHCSSFLLPGILEQRGISILDDAYETIDAMHAYETGQALVTALVNRRLLCEDGGGRITVQKVVKEVVLGIGSDSGKRYLRTGPLIKAPPGRDIWRRFRMIALMDTMIETLPEERPDCPFLSALLLNGNHLLTSIPQSFLANMPCLRVLDLSDTRIGHLPSSLCELVELRVLLLRRCVRLEEVPNINSLKLEVLDLSGATLLKTIGWSTCSSSASPNLTILNLSETSIEELPFLGNLPNLRHLFLSGCRRLKSIAQLSSLTNLELLDLSGTILLEFPYGISKLTQLKCLRLVGSKYTKVEWRTIDWLPEGLKWDQSSCSDITIEPVQDGDGTAFIYADDPGVFWTLDRDSPLWKNCFKKLQFSLCHSDAAGDARFPRKEFVFREAYFKATHFAHSERRDRCLEICGVQGFPRGIEGVLCNSELVALNNLEFLKRLSEFGLADLRGMKECWIENCDQMETVLDDQDDVDFLGAEGSLECLWVSNLTSLRCLFGKMGRAAGSFACLKHLNLDCCPNLVCVFVSAVRLENLETFQIKFCDRLEMVFGDPVLGEDALPKLQSMRLWELPQLKYICDGVLPSLKNLKVKQCPALIKIPVATGDLSPLVVIIGESWWWKKLTWDDQAIKYHLLFRKWGRF